MGVNFTSRRAVRWTSTLGGKREVPKTWTTST